MLSRAAFVDAAIVTLAASAPPPYASRSGVATPPVLVTTCRIRTRAGCSKALSPLCRGVPEWSMRVAMPAFHGSACQAGALRCAAAGRERLIQTSADASNTQLVSPVASASKWFGERTRRGCSCPNSLSRR